jgi:hypothetical protein
MCATSVCVPTPDEARSLIRRGFGKQLARYKFNPHNDDQSVIAPKTVGHDEILDSTTVGGCVFHKDGLCELHELGLKPLEGRLAHHTREPTHIRLHVLRQWAGKRYQRVAAALEKA